jgi:hypothetical protein
VKETAVAIIGAGPYGLSLASHLAARNVEHRIFGRAMQFWSRVAAAGSRRYLKSYCFGTNISTPAAGFNFADYNGPRGLETFEPCSIGNFAQYGQWFQEQKVPWLEPVDVVHVDSNARGFVLALEDGEKLVASQVVIATGLSRFAHIPKGLKSLSSEWLTHTANIDTFSAWKGRRVAVIGAGQSALEAAALLHEAGALPQLIVRDGAISWQHRVSRDRNLWRRLRSPISGLGTGPKAWGLAHFPGVMHRLPGTMRMPFIARYLPPEGAWWLRDRVEGLVSVQVNTTIASAAEKGGQVLLKLHHSDGGESDLVVDHVVAGSGYVIDVDRLDFLDQKLRLAIRRLGSAPRLSSSFETSIPGLRFIGPASVTSFGPLFRFVAGTEYSARTVSDQLVSSSAMRLRDGAISVA